MSANNSESLNDFKDGIPSEQRKLDRKFSITAPIKCVKINSETSIDKRPLLNSKTVSIMRAVNK